MSLGDPRWRQADTVRELLAPTFPEVALRELDAAVPVARADRFAFLELAYYPIDALSDDGKRAFAAFLDGLDGDLAWTFHCRLGVARRTGR